MKNILWKKIIVHDLCTIYLRNAKNAIAPLPLRNAPNFTVTLLLYVHDPYVPSIIYGPEWILPKQISPPARYLFLYPYLPPLALVNPYWRSFASTDASFPLLTFVYSY